MSTCVLRAATCVCVCLGLSLSARASQLTVDLGDSAGVTLVGAFHRWDDDGNATKPVDIKAKIDKPEVDAKATKSGGGKWVFQDLKPGRYDLVILCDNKTRIDGFGFPPILEFDPFMAPTAPAEDEVREFITNDIRRSEYYENKVVPLYIAGNKEQKYARVLVQLLRDKATSYVKGAGTLRHEVWQYDWNYGGWQKNKRTRVFDRILIQIGELRKWHWLWEPKLGDIVMKKEPITITYKIPATPDPDTLKGLYPY